MIETAAAAIVTVHSAIGNYSDINDNDYDADDDEEEEIIISCTVSAACCCPVAWQRFSDRL